MTPASAEQMAEWHKFIRTKWGQGLPIWDIAARMAQKYRLPFRAAEVREMARTIGIPAGPNPNMRTGEVVYSRRDPWPSQHHFHGQDVPDRDKGRIIRFQATARHAERPAGAAA